MNSNPTNGIRRRGTREIDLIQLDPNRPFSVTLQVEVRRDLSHIRLDLERIRLLKRKSSPELDSHFPRRPMLFHCHQLLGSNKINFQYKDVSCLENAGDLDIRSRLPVVPPFYCQISTNQIT
jgi:hypothetical protein